MRLVVKKYLQGGAVAMLWSMAVTVAAENNWNYVQENDRLTNRSFSYARSPMPRTDLYDDLRLDVACKENKLQVIVEADVLIASQGSAFDVEVQLDKQAPVKVAMRTFPDSKRRGFTEQQAKQVADLLLSGQSVFIRVNTMIRRVLSGEMPLNDAATPIKQVYANCGLVPNGNAQAGYSLAEFSAGFAQLTAAQQQTILPKLKALLDEVR